MNKLPQFLIVITIVAIALTIGFMIGLISHYCSVNSRLDRLRNLITSLEVNEKNFKKIYRRICHYDCLEMYMLDDIEYKIIRQLFIDKFVNAFTFNYKFKYKAGDYVVKSVYDKTYIISHLYSPDRVPQGIVKNPFKMRPANSKEINYLKQNGFRSKILSKEQFIELNHK